MNANLYTLPTKYMILQQTIQNISIQTTSSTGR